MDYGKELKNDKMPPSLPLVSVIIPAHNAEQFIEQTLRSVISQTYSKIEIIVIDDGSTDRTAEIVKKIAQEDERLILAQQANAGVAAARNLGIKQSRGQFIAPIDADDLWHPQNLEKQVQCFLQSPRSVGVVYSWSVDIDEQNRLTGETHAATIEGKVFTTLLCHDFLGNASSSLIRRECLQQVGYYNSHLREQDAQGCEDWELYLKIAEQYEFKVVPEFLVGYRKPSRSMSRSYVTMANSHALMLQAAQQRHSEIPGFLYRLSASSFYIYLARQSYQHGSHQSTLFWLYQALQVDAITPCLRSELYLLSIKSVLSIAFGTAALKLLPKQPLLKQPFLRLLRRSLQILQSNESENQDIFPDFDPERLKHSKGILEILLHQGLTVLMRFSLRTKARKLPLQYFHLYKKNG